MGCCTALELARRGIATTLVDAAAEPMQGASRWNEGKLHLGFLYAGDPTLATARKLVPGGVQFLPLLERLLGGSLRELVTGDDDLFLVHRSSVVSAEAFAQYADATIALLREHARTVRDEYPVSLRDAAVQRLTAPELAAITPSSDIVAGFRTPERSISTAAVADRIVAAIRNEPRIMLQLGTRVRGLRRGADDRLSIIGADGLASDPFDVVINAAWEGRPAIDASLDVHPPAPWSHRFRAAVFATLPDAPFESAVVCTGPFGDVKRYADGRVYLSYYHAGLLAEGHDLTPPYASAALDAAARTRVLEGTLDGLARWFPAIDRIRRHVSADDVHGGWVYAVGQGSLADAGSTLHRRDRFDLHADRGYISVDTAKYSIAPWLASRVAALVTTGDVPG